jgi:zinc transport system permease protein
VSGVFEILDYDFMRRALLAAVLIGIAAPVVGTFIVQRKLALLGDGIGHIALTGVALGLVTSTSPVLTAVIVSALGAVAIEILRSRGRTGADVALALLFYGGIAGGVLLTNLAPGGSTANLLAYLFGSISSVSTQDLYVIVGLVLGVLVVIALFGRELFLLCQDEEVARASGHAGRRAAAGERPDGGAGGRRPADHPGVQGHRRAGHGLRRGLRGRRPVRRVRA